MFGTVTRRVKVGKLQAFLLRGQVHALVEMLLKRQIHVGFGHVRGSRGSSELAGIRHGRRNGHLDRIAKPLAAVNSPSLSREIRLPISRRLERLMAASRATSKRSE